MYLFLSWYFKGEVYHSIINLIVTKICEQETFIFVNSASSCDRYAEFFFFFSGSSRRHDSVVAVLQLPRITFRRCHHDHIQLAGDRHCAVLPLPEGALRCPAHSGSLHAFNGRCPRCQTTLLISGNRKWREIKEKLLKLGRISIKLYRHYTKLSTKMSTVE